MTLARTERAALADLFDELGPDQPTLCEGWDTGELLAHLLVRERRADAALGLVVGPLKGWLARVSAGYRQRPWSAQVELFRSGPPMWSPARWGPLDEKINGLEFFIHHEDARRGQPNWEPRALDGPTRDALIQMLASRFVSGRLKKIGVPVTARLNDEPDQLDRPIILAPAANLDIAAAPPGVVLHGGLAEIVLWLAGRSEVRIEFAGDAADVARVRSGREVPAGTVSFDL